VTKSPPTGLRYLDEYPTNSRRSRTLCIFITLWFSGYRSRKPFKPCAHIMSDFSFSSVTFLVDTIMKKTKYLRDPHSPHKLSRAEFSRREPYFRFHLDRQKKVLFRPTRLPFNKKGERVNLFMFHSQMKHLFNV